MVEKKFGLSKNSIVNRFSGELGFNTLSTKTWNNFVVDPCSVAPISFFVNLAPYIDYVKIPYSINLLYPEEAIKERIDCYKKHGVKVNVDCLLTCNFIVKKRFKKFIQLIQETEFDTIEFIESPNITLEELYVAINMVKSETEMEIIVFLNNIFKKPLEKRIEDYQSKGVNYFIFSAKSNNRFPSFIFTHDGRILWDSIFEVLDLVDLRRVVFEADNREVILELMNGLSKSINLYLPNYKLLPEIEILRYQGVTPIEKTEILKRLRGGPSIKFIYYLLLNEGPLDTKEIVSRSGLSIRTVQDTLKKLSEMGLVKQVSKASNKFEKIWVAIGGHLI